MLPKYDENDPRDVFAQSIEVVELKEVVKVRELIKTNRPFPALSFRETDPTVMRQSSKQNKEQVKAYVMAHSRLVSRRKYLLVSKSEGSIEALRAEETDEGFEDTQLRCEFRGETEKGGSCPDWLYGEKAFDQLARMRPKNVDPLGFHRRAPSLQGHEFAADDCIDLTVSAPYEGTFPCPSSYHYGGYSYSIKPTDSKLYRWTMVLGRMLSDGTPLVIASVAQVVCPWEQRAPVSTSNGVSTLILRPSTLTSATFTRLVARQLQHTNSLPY